MLPIQYRLKTKQDFDAAKKKGQITSGKLFSFVYLDRGDSEFSRFGFIVSIKISKRAVVRNRIKRLLREAVQANILNLKPGYDCVFLSKTALIGKRYDEVLGEVNLILEKSGIHKQ